jgi:ribonuclease BN (tRNA processing enzyme)
MNKLTFLGTAGDSICIARKNLGAGGLIIQTEGLQFHFDPGPGALQSAQPTGINLRDTDAVIVTNNSPLSSNEAQVVAEFSSLEGADKHGVFIGAQSVVTNQMQKYFERVIAVKPEDKVSIGDVNITAKRAQNKDETAISIHLETPEYSLGYIPDTNLSKTLAKDLAAIDILVMHIKNPKEITEEKTLNLDQAIEMIEIIQPKLAIITGMGSKIQSTLDVIRTIQKETKVQTMVATDGLAINASTYRRPRQTKLQ